jgi:SAM-dependent methyltransferase
MDFSGAFADQGYFKLSDEEAAFGFSEVSRLLTGRHGLACLEVGSGPALLLAKLKDAFRDSTFEGIEPVGSGFAKTEAPLAKVRERARLTIHRCGYEAFKTDRRFDLIFSINVFEHVSDWRHYLRWSYDLLAPGGVSLILCPNYAFPWEPHFRIPTVINKAITARLFAQTIAAHERDHDYAGLWSSLNYVTKRQVLAYARANGLTIDSDEKIMRRMFQRLFTDSEFATRQRALASLARMLYRLGITRIFELPGMRLMAPFMALRLAKVRA